MIHWIVRSPYLLEARVTTADGADLFAGYVAMTPGNSDWRGYIGRGFVPLGLGPLMEMRAAVAQRAVEIVAHLGGEDLHHVS